MSGAVVGFHSRKVRQHPKHLPGRSNPSPARQQSPLCRVSSLAQPCPHRCSIGAQVQLDLHLQRGDQGPERTFSGHHGDVLKASKRSHKVQEYGPILVEAMWRMEPQVRILEHLPPLWNWASLSAQ